MDGWYVVTKSFSFPRENHVSLPCLVEAILVPRIGGLIDMQHAPEEEITSTPLCRSDVGRE